MNDVTNPSKRAYMKNAVLGAVAAVIGIKSAAAVVTNVAENHVTTDNATIGGYDAVNHFAAPAPHTGHAHRSVADILTIGTSGEEFATPQIAYDYIEGNIDGNQIMRMSAGTYAGTFDIGGKSVSGAYCIEIEAATTSSLVNTTLTGMSAGTQTVKPTITKTGAGWTVNAYAGKWVSIDDGVNAGEIRLISSNTAEVLTLSGVYFTTASSSGDVFTIFDNNVDITGLFTGIPSPVQTRFKNINLHSMLLTQQNIIFEQSHHHDLKGRLCNLRYEKSYLYADSTPTGTALPLSLELYSGYTYMEESIIQGVGKATVAIGAFVPSGLMDVYKGSIMSDLYFAAYARDRFVINGGTGNKTNPQFINNEFGVYASEGGKIYHASEVTYAGNTTDAFAQAASFSWVG